VGSAVVSKTQFLVDFALWALGFGEFVQLTEFALYLGRAEQNIFVEKVASEHPYRSLSLKY
jgi:hypothetical protein